MPGAISGTLFDYLTGKPLAGWPSHPDDSIYAIGLDVWAEAETTPNYSNAVYQILDLPAGSYRVEVDLGGTSFDVDTGIPVADGQVTQHDFYLSLAGSLSGTVLGVPGGAPLAEAGVLAYQARSPYGEGRDAVSDSQGKFAWLDLTAVDDLSRQQTLYDVWAFAADRSFGVLLDVAVAPGEGTHVELDLPYSAQLYGTVTDFFGAGVPYALIVLIQLSGVGQGLVYWTYSDEYGTYGMADLQAPASYQVLVYGPDWVTSATDVVALDPGSIVLRDYALAAAGAWITGVVTRADTGSPIPGAMLVLEGEDVDIGPTFLFADESGEYGWVGLPWPGTYTIKAWGDGYQAGTVEVNVTSCSGFVADTIQLPAVGSWFLLVF